MKLLVLVGLVAAVGAASASATALARSGAEHSQVALIQPRAFQRPARPSDALPGSIVPFVARRYGKIVGSRRIATAAYARGHATLYVARFARHYTCMIGTLDGGAGVGCSPSHQFLSAKRLMQVATGSRILQGVVTTEVARVAFVDPRGQLHRLNLTRGGGFLHACGHRNGCVGFVTAVNGYNKLGRLLFHEDL